MGGEWTTIGAVAEVFDGPHATPNKIEEGPYFLSISSLENGKLDLSKSARISEEQFKKWTKRVTPKEGDVLFSYETRLGEAALVPKGITACLGRRMGLLRPNIDKVDPGFLLFAYLGPAFQQEIRTRTNYGATVERIALKELPNFPIQIPGLSEQKSIAHILGTLDDKIELNHQMNATLESMAQALFKSWFVDFDPVIDNALAAGNPIPDELQERTLRRQQQLAKPDHKPLPEDIRQLFPSEFELTEELGWVPKGWGAETIASIANALSGFAFKGKDFSETGEAVIKIKNINADRTVNITDVNRVSAQVALTAERFLLTDGDIVMAMTGATVGKFGIIASEDKESYFLNQRVCKLTPKAKNGNVFLYAALNKPGTEEGIVDSAQGSAQPNISASAILSTSMTVPTNDIIELFIKRMEPTYKKRIGLIKQNYKLAKLRDTLLPTLISGELRIPEAESQIEKTLA